LARFAEAQRRAPGLYSAHTQTLQNLCAKWFGSHEEMFEFAHSTSASAPDGSPLHVLVAKAHQECQASMGKADQDRYRTNSAVRYDIESSARRALTTGDLAQTPQRRLARDSFAEVANLFGMHQLTTLLQT
jgi:hypothetical protein